MVEEDDLQFLERCIRENTAMLSSTILQYRPESEVSPKTMLFQNVYVKRNQKLRL